MNNSSIFHIGSTDDNIIDDIMRNNGIDVKTIRFWKKGDSFIVQEDDDEWIDPKEIIIKSITKSNSDDVSITTSLDSYYDIIGICGTEIKMTTSIMRPSCEDYEIYKNWATYFGIHNEKTKKLQKKVERLKNTIGGYTKFFNKFSDDNPEKLI